MANLDENKSLDVKNIEKAPPGYTALQNRALFAKDHDTNANVSIYALGRDTW